MLVIPYKALPVEQGGSRAYPRGRGARRPATRVRVHLRSNMNLLQRQAHHRYHLSRRGRHHHIRRTFRRPLSLRARRFPHRLCASHPRLQRRPPILLHLPPTRLCNLSHHPPPTNRAPHRPSSTRISPSHVRCQLLPPRPRPRPRLLLNSHNRFDEDPPTLASPRSSRPSRLPTRLVEAAPAATRSKVAGGSRWSPPSMAFPEVGRVIFERPAAQAFAPPSLRVGPQPSRPSFPPPPSRCTIEDPTHRTLVLPTCDQSRSHTLARWMERTPAWEAG